MVSGTGLQPPVVILDRDGVINEESEHYIRNAIEWKPVPGSLEAIRLLTRHGCRIYIATNQAGIGRGLFTLEDLHCIHEELLRQVRRTGGHISGIRFCPHHPDRDCDCRKPRPGMLRQIFREADIAPEDAVFVGDSGKDIEAARAAGCRPVLVLTGYGTITRQEYPRFKPVYPDLLAFSRHYISL